MATLSSFQKITRVYPGQPFGSGVDGVYSSATIPTLTKDSCSGSATSSTLTTSSATFANGDLLLIHQSRGTGVGQWEINRVLSGGGTTSLTLQVALNYTYTDSGASQAQAIKIPQYTSCTVQSGTWTVPTWDGNVGGILPLAVKNKLTITGVIEGAGTDGNNVSPSLVQSVGGVGGYRGGAAVKGGSGYQGEGTANASSQATSANGNGGGGSDGGGTDGAGGGSGGNGTAGTQGVSGSGTRGSAGGLGGSSDLITLTFGGGGGGSGVSTSTIVQGAGGGGGTIVILMAKTIEVVGSLSLNGGGGGNGDQGRYGGPGAGGSGLIVCSLATLGSGKLTATGGSTAGISGGSGIFAIHHSDTVTGTTNPTYNDVTDGTLVEQGGSFIFNLL